MRRASSYSGANPFSADLDSDDAMRRLDFDPFARLDAAFGVVEADAERGGFAEEDGDQVFACFWRRDHLHENAGTSFFHLRGDDDGIERAGFEQTFHGVADDLRRGVVDVGFDHA